VTTDKGRAGLANVVGRFRAGERTLDEALVEVRAKSLLRHAGRNYILHANHEAYASLAAGQPDGALVWASAAQEALDYLRPPPRNLGGKLSRRITSAIGLSDGVLAYSEYIAGVAALRLGRYDEARKRIVRAQTISEYAASVGFTAADCRDVLGRIPT
jgi:hypothetical protein